MTDEQGAPISDDATEKTKERDPKPKDVMIDFSVLQRAKKKPDATGIIMLAPEEIGIDREEIGLGPKDRIAFHYGPLKGGEEGEVRELIKDYEMADGSWGEEYRWEIIRRGMIRPAIPNDFEGREQVDRWLPGTRGQIAQAILNQTGMGLHEIKNAKDELANLHELTSTGPGKRQKSTG